MIAYARTLALLVVLTLVGCSKMSIRSATPHETAHPEWTYAGEHGPQHWAEDFPECGMTGQSPVDIRDAEPADLPPLEFTYAGVDGRIRDTGHAVQVDSEGGTLLIGEAVHVLLQLHFHVPSEHTIEGEHFDAVIHLVHLDPDSQIAVVGVPISVGDENSYVEDVLDEMDKPVASREEVELEDILPEDLTYYSYLGSLTTPPCSRGVQWYMLANPIEASRTQIDRLATHYRGNVRPVQALDGRTITRSR